MMETWLVMPIAVAAQHGAVMATVCEKVLP
jgi:hypothetical protein